MVDYREILRLSADPKNSLRRIELIVHSDHRKISEAAARAAGVSDPLEAPSGLAFSRYTSPLFLAIHKVWRRQIVFV